MATSKTPRFIQTWQADAAGEQASEDSPNRDAEQELCEQEA